MARVMLIDDDPNERKLFEFYLIKRFGADFELHYAPGTKEAVEFLQKTSVDAVFLDNRLRPHRDFRDTLPSLSALVGDTPIYLISASIDEPCFREHGNYGVRKVIDKYHMKDSIIAERLLG